MARAALVFGEQRCRHVGLAHRSIGTAGRNGSTASLVALHGQGVCAKHIATVKDNQGMHNACQHGPRALAAAAQRGPDGASEQLSANKTQQHDRVADWDDLDLEYSLGGDDGTHNAAQDQAAQADTAGEAPSLDATQPSARELPHIGTATDGAESAGASSAVALPATQFGRHQGSYGYDQMNRSKPAGSSAAGMQHPRQRQAWQQQQQHSAGTGEQSWQQRGTSWQGQAPQSDRLRWRNEGASQRPHSEQQPGRGDYSRHAETSHNHSRSRHSHSPGQHSHSSHSRSRSEHSHGVGEHSHSYRYRRSQHSVSTGEHGDSHSYRRSEHIHSQRELNEGNNGFAHGSVVTKAIGRCNNSQELLHIWQLHGARFNQVHYAAMISRLAKVLSKGSVSSDPATQATAVGDEVQPLLQQLDAGFARNIHLYTAREVCMTVWAWGKLSHQPRAETWQAVRTAICQPPAPVNGYIGSESPSGTPWHPQEGGQQPVSSLLLGATPQGLAMLCWGLSQLGCPDEGVWAVTETAVRRSMPELQPRDLSNIAWALASAGRHRVSLFHELAAAAEPRVLDFTSQDMSNLAWAFAAVGHPYRPLFDAIASAAVQLLHAFTPQGLANLAWAFAQARVPAPALFRGIAREAAGRLSKFDPGHLTMLAWAVARSGDWCVPLLSSISSMVQADMQAFKTKELVTVMWSLAYSGASNEPLLVVAPQELMQRLQQQDMSWQDLAHALWALAVAEKYHPAFFSTACEACLSGWPSLRASSAEALDTIVTSLASCGHYDPQLFSKVAEALATMRIQASEDRWVEQRHDTRDEQQGYEPAAATAADTTGASSERGRPRGPLKAGAGSSRGSGGGGQPVLLLQPAQAGTLLSALARLGHRDMAACAAVAREIERVVRSSPDQVPISAMCNCLWALAVLDHPDLTFVATVAAYLSRMDEQSYITADELGAGKDYEAGQARKLSQQLDLVNSWQARRGGSKASQRQLLQQLLPGALALRRSGLELPSEMFPLREAMQLLQTWLWVKDMRGNPSRAEKAEVAAAVFPARLLRSAAATWRKAATEQLTVSLTQKQVHAFLRVHMGLKPQLEKLTDDGMFSIDMVVPWRGVKVALEVNGPSHYASTLDTADSPSIAQGTVSSAREEVALHRPFSPTDQEPAGGGAVAGVSASKPPARRGRPPAQARLQGAPPAADVLLVAVPCVPVPRKLGYKQLRDRFVQARGFAVANLSWLEWRAVQDTPEKAVAYMGAVLDAAVASAPGLRAVAKPKRTRAPRASSEAPSAARPRSARRTVVQPGAGPT